VTDFEHVILCGSKWKAKVESFHNSKKPVMCWEHMYVKNQEFMDSVGRIDNNKSKSIENVENKANDWMPSDDCNGICKVIPHS